MDNELFELCKEVYKLLPTWNNKEKMYWQKLGNTDFDKVSLLNYGQITTRDGAMICPLYTSDYLLEKLLNNFNSEYCETRLTTSVIDFELGVRWRAETKREGGFYRIHEADTPLKAILKLILALQEAGELE